MGVQLVKSFNQVRIPMVTLTLSSEYVFNTTFTNEQGQVIYKTETPFKLGFGTGTTTIYKITPNADTFDMRDQFEPEVIGQIEWHTYTSDKFRFGGTEVATKDFIPNRGLTSRVRIFTGPDGSSYRWDLVLNSRVVLSRNDGSRAELARSHQATLGIIGKKRKATLQVSPEVSHMMDTVIMTFIYVEKLRRGERAVNRTSSQASAAAFLVAG